MIHIIMGLKGSGKTKRLIDSINETVMWFALNMANN